METKAVGFSSKFDNAVAYANEALSFLVTTAEGHRMATEKIDTIRGWEKDLDTEYKTHPTIIEARELQRQKGELAELLESCRKTLKRRQMDYEDRQEAIRKAEEARLAEEARKKAEEEQRAIEAQKRKESEAALAAAAEAEKKGNHTAAEMALDHAAAAEAEAKEAAQTPVTVPTVVLPKTAPKTANRRKIVKFRYVDQNGKEITEAQANTLGLVPRQYCKVDPVKIGGVVRAMGEAANIPGIQVYTDWA